ncbi:hypothetical protein MLD52_08540 [Puniceicoccaceae bacterium K14]|nr:hypothetical protein [Puniceicoccaceae bacterium K14]
MNTEKIGKRRIVALKGDGSFKIEETDIPDLDAGMVLIEVKASLISPGSELKGASKQGRHAAGGWRVLRDLQLNPDPDLNRRGFGYSNTGIVVAVGENVTTVQPGDRVAAVGVRYAQHATYTVVPQNLVVGLPDEVSFERGSYAMLLATAMQAVRRAKPELGEYVAVAGLGLVGLLTARLFQLAGCYVIGWDTVPARLENAKKLGIGATVLVGSEDTTEKTLEFTQGKGLDTCVLALGGNAEKPANALEKCMKVAPDGHPMGVMIVVGGAEFPFTRTLTNIDIRRSSRTGPGYHDKEWERGGNYGDVFVRWDTRENLELCMRWLKEGKVAVETLTTHEVPFDCLEEEMAEISKDPDSILGLVFKMGDES